MYDQINENELKIYWLLKSQIYKITLDTHFHIYISISNVILYIFYVFDFFV